MCYWALAGLCRVGQGAGTAKHTVVTTSRHGAGCFIGLGELRLATMRTQASSCSLVPEDLHTLEWGLQGRPRPHSSTAFLEKLRGCLLLVPTFCPHFPANCLGYGPIQSHWDSHSSAALFGATQPFPTLCFKAQFTTSLTPFTVQVPFSELPTASGPSTQHPAVRPRGCVHIHPLPRAAWCQVCGPGSRNSVSWMNWGGRKKRCRKERWADLGCSRVRGHGQGRAAAGTAGHLGLPDANSPLEAGPASCPGKELAQDWLPSPKGLPPEGEPSKWGRPVRRAESQKEAPGKCDSTEELGTWERKQIMMHL